MYHLLNYALVEMVKYTTKYLLNSIKALVLEKNTFCFSEKRELQLENLFSANHSRVKKILPSNQFQFS